MGRYLFRLPDVGEGIAEAEVIAWHVAPGDLVAEDAPLVDVMTDKATVEITSPVGGQVVALHAEVGVHAAVGTVIVVLEVDFGGEEIVLGALTDAVREVLELSDEQIEPPPRLGMKLKTEFIRGMGKQGESFIILLDVDRVFTSDELCVIQAAEESVS